MQCFKKQPLKLWRHSNHPVFLERLVKSSWNREIVPQAKALFYLLKDTFSLGILWKIIKSLCSNMSTWDWIKAGALITAQLIAAFATDGLALIAKIVLALNSAYDFYKKIKNLNEIRAVA